MGRSCPILCPFPTGDGLLEKHSEVFIIVLRQNPSKMLILSVPLEEAQLAKLTGAKHAGFTLLQSKLLNLLRFLAPPGHPGGV
jgi:hypothetical protein